MLTPANFVEGVRGPFKNKVFEVDAAVELVNVADYTTERLKLTFPSKSPIKDWQ